MNTKDHDDDNASQQENMLNATIIRVKSILLTAHQISTTTRQLYNNVDRHFYNREYNNYVQ